MNKFIPSLIFLLLMLLAKPFYAYEINENISVSGYAHLWATVYEQMDGLRGTTQESSEEESALSLSGFSVRRIFIWTDLSFLDNSVGFRAMVKIHSVPSVRDLYIRYSIDKWLEIYVGQMKIPSAYEVLTSFSKLDFILPSQITSVIVDYSLSRSVYVSSDFYGVKTYYRDMGIAFKGNVNINIGSFRYFAMISNGLGANMFFSGDTFKQYMISNAAQFFYGLRLELFQLFDIITIGGHYNYNKHDNISDDSGRSGRVYDIYKMSWSGDIRIKIPYCGIILTVLYGGGFVWDNYETDEAADLSSNKKQLEYSGYEAKIMFSLKEFLTCYFMDDRGWYSSHTLELGFRYDSYFTESDESDIVVKQHDFTAGINYCYMQYLTVQMNFIYRYTVDPNPVDVTNPDPDDNIFFINFQFSI